jgi:hypothetical protein
MGLYPLPAKTHTWVILGKRTVACVIHPDPGFGNPLPMPASRLGQCMTPMECHMGSPWRLKKPDLHNPQNVV